MTTTAAAAAATPCASEAPRLRQDLLRTAALQFADGTELLCMLSLDVCENPVHLNVSGGEKHVYEREAASLWLAKLAAAGKALVSPMSFKPLIDSTLIPANDIAKRLKDLDSKLPMIDIAPAGAGLEARKMVMSDIFFDLDRLRDLDLIKQLGLVVPRIYVIGDEKSGKSTLLERLVGFPVLPRNAIGQGRCTRCLIRVKLVRRVFALPQVAVVERDPSTGKSGAEVANSVEYGAIDSLCKIVERKMKQLVDAVKAVNAANEMVLDKEIHVTITVPYAPDLELVDVPGIVSSGPGDIVAQTRALAESVLKAEPDCATVMFVCPAATQLSNSSSVALVSQPQLCSAARCVGVFSMLDCINTSDDEYTIPMMIGERISHSGNYPSSAAHKNVASSWLGVANRDTRSKKQKEEGTESLRMHAMDLYEDDFFGTKAADLIRHGLVTKPADCLGAQAVRRAVQQKFERTITRIWCPQISERVVTHFWDAVKENSMIGAALPNDSDYKPFVDYLTRSLPQLTTKIANFPIESLALQSHTQWRTNLVMRITSVQKQTNKDWLKMGSVTTFHTAKSQWCARVDAAEGSAAWKALTWANVEPEMRAEQQRIAALFDSLKTVLRAHALVLPELLVAAIVNKQEADKERGVLENIRTVFNSLWRSVSNQNDGVQSKLLEIGRMNGLVAELRKFVLGTVKAGIDKFDSDVEVLRTEMMYEPVAADHAADPANAAGPLKAPLSYTRGASYVRRAPDLIMGLWLKHVVAGILPAVMSWQIPAAAIGVEENKAKRLTVLKSMQEACEVLRALRDLESKYAKAASESEN